MMATLGTSIPTEQRQFPRIPFSNPVSFLWGGRSITGVGQNVSGNGILLSVRIERTWVGRALERGLLPGASLRLFFTLQSADGEKRQMNVMGKIVRMNRSATTDSTELALMFQ